MSDILHGLCQRGTENLCKPLVVFADDAPQIARTHDARQLSFLAQTAQAYGENSCR